MCVSRHYVDGAAGAGVKRISNAQRIWSFFKDNAEGLKGLGAALAGLAAVLTVMLSIWRKPEPTSNKNSSAPTAATSNEAVKQRTAPDVRPSTKRSRRAPEKIIAELQAVRAQLKPPPLTSDIFPPGLNVVQFKEAEVLKVILPGTQGIWASGGWFSFVHFSLIPGVFAATMFGEYAGYAGAAAGFVYWCYLVRRGALATINLKTKRWSVFSVIGGFWGAAAPTNIGLETEYVKNAWRTRLVFGAQTLWQGVSESKAAADALEAAAEPFTDSLRHALDLPVEVADGIFIHP
jgi:hypothetical protein